MEMMMMSREELMEIVLDSDWESCEDCSLCAVCGKHELYWGCTVWEETMGEDL